ncbi:MAG: hypothetical protein ACREHD_33445, partial [Pirellulales bacterium]
YGQFDGNDGPLVRLNKIGNVVTNVGALNGMLVRGGTLEAASVWDDTDIVHVLEGTVIVPNFAGSGGLRLQSSTTQSLVVKSTPGSGIIASGTALDISNRIGGEVQILGTPQHPVVMTSYRDNTVGAGLTPTDKPDNETWPGGASTVSVAGTLVASNSIFVSPPTGNTAGISAPTQNGPSTSGSGGTLATGTYYYEVTAVSASGETNASNEQSIAVTGPTGQVTVNWTTVANATGYKIYRGISAGGENVLVGVVNNGKAASFTDLGGGAAPGDWGAIDTNDPKSTGGGVILDQYSNDRNVAMINQTAAGPTPATAQLLGTLAPNLQSCDDNSRLGFQVNGYMGPQEIDTYAFKATAGTQVWINVTNTASALDAVLELVDANGNVLARSDNAGAEQRDAAANGDPLAAGPLLKGELPNNLAQPLQSGVFGTDGLNFWSTNPYDPGFRVTLPGTPSPNPNTYYLRVYAKNQDPTSPYSPGHGAAAGQYELQVRLQEQVEIPGSTVANADIRYATSGIDVSGLPAHSPLISNTTAVGTNTTTSGAASVNGQPGPAGSNPGTSVPAQNLGDLLTSDTSSLDVSGNLANWNTVQWYT